MRSGKSYRFIEPLGNGIFQLTAVLKRHVLVVKVRSAAWRCGSAVPAQFPLNLAAVAKPNPLSDFVQHLQYRRGLCRRPFRWPCKPGGTLVGFGWAPPRPCTTARHAIFPLRGVAARAAAFCSERALASLRRYDSPSMATISQRCRCWDNSPCAIKASRYQVVGRVVCVEGSAPCVPTGARLRSSVSRCFKLHQ